MRANARTLSLIQDETIFLSFVCDFLGPKLNCKQEMEVTLLCCCDYLTFITTYARESLRNLRHGTGNFMIGQERLKKCNLGALRVYRAYPSFMSKLTEQLQELKTLDVFSPL